MLISLNARHDTDPHTGGNHAGDHFFVGSFINYFRVNIIFLKNSFKVMAGTALLVVGNEGFLTDFLYR